MAADLSEVEGLQLTRPHLSPGVPGWSDGDQSPFFRSNIRKEWGGVVLDASPALLITGGELCQVD